MAENDLWGVWLTDFGEWLGARDTATEPDLAVRNPALVAAEVARLGGGGIAPEQAVSHNPESIALWRTRKGARAEIHKFEPEHFEKGSERIRRYTGT